MLYFYAKILRESLLSRKRRNIVFYQYYSLILHCSTPMVFSTEKKGGREQDILKAFIDALVLTV